MMLSLLEKSLELPSWKKVWIPWASYFCSTFRLLAFQLKLTILASLITGTAHPAETYALPAAPNATNAGPPSPVMPWLLLPAGIPEAARTVVIAEAVTVVIEVDMAVVDVGVIREAEGGRLGRVIGASS